MDTTAIAPCREYRFSIDLKGMKKTLTVVAETEEAAREKVLPYVQHKKYSIVSMSSRECRFSERTDSPYGKKKKRGRGSRPSTHSYAVLEKNKSKFSA